MTTPQILASAIFLIMFIAIMAEKWHRYVSALIGAVLMIVLVLRTEEAILWVLNLGEIFEPAFWMLKGIKEKASHGINWQTIVFIAGMMIMIEGLARLGFFRWLCFYIAKLVNYKIIPIFISFMILSGFLSMFIDSITVMLFLSSVTIELARLLKFNPIPIIISEIFASNVGGSATMSGDPPNIIIGTAFGFTFTDFLVNTGVIAWLCVIFTIGFFYYSFKKQLSVKQQKIGKYPEPKGAITHKELFTTYTILFIVIVVLIVTHGW